MSTTVHRIFLASDHAGFEHKNLLKEYLMEEGFDVVDCGAEKYDPLDDFPHFIKLAAAAVSKDPDTVKAIIFGGSGQGEAMLANRFKRVRAAVYYGGDMEIVKLSREHNDANVLSIGARFVSKDTLCKIVKIWLSTDMLPDTKYQRRIDEIRDITDEMH